MAVVSNSYPTNFTPATRVFHNLANKRKIPLPNFLKLRNKNIYKDFFPSFF